MYFLPEDEVNRCTVSSKLENNIKLMRKIELHNTPRECDRFVKYGQYGILFSRDGYPNKISCHKFDHYGIIDQYDSVLYDSVQWIDIDHYDSVQWLDSVAIDYNIEVIEALPVVLIGRGFHRSSKYKLCFSDVSGNDLQSTEVQGITFDVGMEYGRCSIFSKSKYIATFFDFLTPDGSTIGFFFSLLILFEIRLTKDNCYECVEISRIDIEEHINWDFFDLENMIVNETEEKILFHITRNCSQTYSQTVLLLYDVETRTMENNIIAFENSKESLVYFVDHLDFKVGIIIAESYQCREIKLYTKNSEMSYVIFKLFPFKFNYRDPRRFYCISNRRNQVLFFEVGITNVNIYDLFDMSNETVLTITPERTLSQLHFNKTGEEIFIYNGTKMCIYVYKSVLKSLILQCASVVARTYTKSQPIEMRLPKHFYKYF